MPNDVSAKRGGRVLSFRMTRGRWFFALTVLVLVSACTAVFLKELARERKLSMDPPSKKELMLREYDQKAFFQGKGGNFVEIQITSPNKADAGVGSVIDLVAKVSVRKDSEALEYAWVLPPGVSLASGELKGELGRLDRGQSAEIRLSVIKRTERNQQIHLHVFKLVGRQRQGNVAQYNTVDQDKIDTEIKSKAEMLRMPASTDQQRKIMQ